MDNGMACAYCGRRDQPDYAGNCNGCGAVHARSDPIDVTTIGSKAPQIVWSVAGVLTPNEVRTMRAAWEEAYRGR